MSEQRPVLVTRRRTISDEGLTAWLLMRLGGLAFEHKVAVTPSQAGETLPALLVDGERIETSFGIASFLADLIPDLWPLDMRLRTQARASAALAFGRMRRFRTYLPQSISERFEPSARLLHHVEREFAALRAHWLSRLDRAHGDGPFLFGDFSAADAFHAPLAARCVTYGLTLDEAVEAYVESVMSWPAMTHWQEMAALDPTAPHSQSGLSLTQLPVEEPLAAELTPAGPASEPDDEDLDRTIFEERPKPSVEPALIKPKPMQPVREADTLLPDRPFHHPTAEKAEPAPAPDEAEDDILPRPRRPFRPFDKKPAEREGREPAKAGADDTRRALARSPAVKPIGGEIRRRR